MSTVKKPQPMTIPLLIRHISSKTSGQGRSSGWLLQSLSIFACFYMLANSVYAQTLQLRYTFEDTGTTTASDPSGAISVPLNMLSFANAATDLHGASNSGIQNPGHALDLTSAS